jgi:hypothetical protein
MADAERKVILRLQVIPDSGNAKAAATIGKLVDAATKKQVDGSKKAADAATKDAERSAKAAEAAYNKQAAEATRAYSRIMRERDRQAKAAEAAADREAAAAVSAYSKIMRAREKEAGQLEALQEKAGAYKKAIGQAGLESAQGALKAAKGFATLGLVSEKSTEKLLRGLVMIQGAYDILEGGFKIWKGLSDGAELVNKALRVQITLEATLAAIRARGGKAAAGSAVAGAAGGVAQGVGAAGGAAAGVGGGVGALASAAAGLAGFVALAAAAAVALVEVGTWLGRLAGFKWDGPTQALLGWKKAADDLAKSEKAVAAAEERRARGDHLLRKNAEQAAQETRSGQIRQGLGFQGTLNSLSGADPVATARAEAAAAASRLQGAKQTRIGQISGGLGDITTGVEAGLEDSVNAQQRLAEAEKARVESLKQQQQLRQQGLQTAKAELQTAQDALKAEQDRYKSTLARFGALKETEQEQLRRISEKVQGGGQINQEEARFLQQTGIGGGVAESFFAQQGAGQGGNAVLQGLGEGAGVAAAQGNVSAAQEKVRTAEEELAATTTTLNSAMATLKTEIENLGAVMNEALRFDQERRTGSAEGAVQVGIGGAGDSTAGTVAEAAGSVAAQNREIAAALGTAFKEIEDAQAEILRQIESRRGRSAAVAAAQA